MTTEERFNEIYVDGVHLQDVISGDVDAIETQVVELREEGGGVLTVRTSETTYYRLLVSPHTSVITRYRDY
ncbi:hypothetical protein ACLRGF_14335 [Mycetocola zhadangensis]|uniref:hypothetical protein n=1 Tax=Mycetocola zhadangensis TaxID=1164595 RepID=UPI003A4D33C3